MLIELAVRDLGVIDDLSLVFGPGMTAVTGETGAGKTLIIGAIDLLTGGRADASLVRPGAAEAEIEGRFVLGGDEIVVRRVIPADGRSRAYVDGRLATVGELAERGVDLVDLHGQHAHQSLLRAAVQRDLLDRFGSVDTSELRSLHDRLGEVDTALAELGGDERERAREIDLLRFQLREIDDAAIDDGAEDERLDREEDLLAGAIEHRDSAARVVALLDSDGVAAEALGEASAALGDRPPFAEPADRLRAAMAEIADVVAEVRDTAEGIDDDPSRLAFIRERRALLRELRRKYGDTLADVVAFGADSAERLVELESRDERAADLDARRAALLARLDEERAAVLAARRRAAPILADAAMAHLGDLAMPGARMEVAVDGTAGDEVVLRLAANAGHEPLPLAKVASGGELARTMLALRLVLTAGPPSLVFDEVDAGIGGDAANAVGSSLARLGERHQVFVVTHLAQVAAFADHHVAISKSDRDGRTVSAAHVLDDDDRVVELSRMLSGSPDSDTARSHANELLAAARR